MCLQGECLLAVLLYSLLQVLECPLRRERFEPGIQLWAEFQGSFQNSQGSSRLRLAGQKGCKGEVSLLHGLHPRSVPHVV